MTYYCGVYLGLTPNSGFVPHKFDSIEQVMLYVKSHLEWIKEKSYGFIVFTDETVREGKHDVPKQLLSWHRDGDECKGEIVNPSLGWRIYIDAAGNIAEDHFEPKGG